MNDREEIIKQNEAPKPGPVFTFISVIIFLYGVYAIARDIQPTLRDWGRIIALYLTAI